MDFISIKNKRILVTGGDGYLGTFLVNRLKRENANVFVISLGEKEEENYFNVDITNFDELNEVIQKIRPEIIVHLAAYLSRERDFSVYEKMEKINVQGTFNLLKALHNIDYSNFIFTSSSEIYGNNLSPFSETQLPNPVSPYSLSKVHAETLIETFSAQYAKNYTILRLFNFYGPNMPEDYFIPQMINSLSRNQEFRMTKGEQKRDFMYVDDVLEALVLTIKSNGSHRDIYNVCSGVGTQLSELAEHINRVHTSNSKINIGALPYRNNEVWEMIGDNSKIKSRMGWSPKISISEGIDLLID